MRIYKLGVNALYRALNNIICTLNNNNNNISPSKAKMGTINNAKKIKGRKVGRRNNLDTEGV